MYNQALSTHLLFFSLFLSSLTSIYLIFNAPVSQPPQVLQQLQPKSTLFTRSVPINHLSTKKTVTPRSSPVRTMFSSRNRKKAPPQPRGRCAPQRCRGVSPSIRHIRELSRVSQIKQHSHTIYLPQTTDHHYRHYHRNHRSSCAAQRYPTTRPTR